MDSYYSRMDSYYSRYVYDIFFTLSFFLLFLGLFNIIFGIVDKRRNNSIYRIELISAYIAFTVGILMMALSTLMGAWK